MTRFYQEINGLLGDYWKLSAEKELHKKVEQAKLETIVEGDGAIRWINSGNYLMDDYCEILEYANYKFSREATAQKRNQQNKEFINNYKNNYKGFSDEEKIELDYNNKPGTKIINIITGDYYITK